MADDPASPAPLDKGRVRRFFDAAAESYDAAAVLQHEVGRRLIERLDYVRLRPAVVLDVGAGTGVTTAELGRRYRRSRLLALDLSPRMLQRARRRAPWFRRQGHLVGDAQRLPLAGGCCDLVFSNLTLQWCERLEAALAEFRRVLRPGGLLMFTTFGPDTLQELRRSWAAADGYSHVSAFPDMHDVGDALLRARFADPVMDTERFTLTYPTVARLVQDLRAWGARNATQGRARGLTGRRRARAMAEAYEGFRRDGVLPATYEVVYGHAWVPEAAAAVSVPFPRLDPRRR
ncbi:MAG: malonyl-ACP O-methyltransferase BioC [Gammaproteobacteria bacterium]|nr:malonyl-ACP O-methyltransferase BioC [Gammaproteobacteria bacterium]